MMWVIVVLGVVLIAGFAYFRFREAGLCIYIQGLEREIRDSVPKSQITEKIIQHPKPQFYVVVNSMSNDGDTTKFVIECCQKMSEGWTPQGGVMVSHSGMYTVYNQAFVK